jgi:hypothetical protein
MPAMAEVKEHRRPIVKPMKTMKTFDRIQASFSDGYWIKKGKHARIKIKGTIEISNFQ